jgi:hypothetical protein
LNIRLSSAVGIPVDEGRYCRVLQVLIKFFHIQAKLLGDCLYLRIAEVFLVCEQFVMHLPKLLLLGCSERCYGCLPRVRMHREGVLLNDKLNLFRELLQHLLEEGLKPRTVWSLVVVVNGDGYGRILGSFVWKAAYVDLINAFEHDHLQHLLLAARN